MAKLPFTPSEKRALLALFGQHWENVRHIKNERLSFMNTYSIVTAGILSLLRSVTGEPVLELSLLLFLCVFSIIGLLTSLRLKSELEECLRSIGTIVDSLGMEAFMSVVDGQGIRYPKFRWLFPVFYSVACAGFIALFIYKLREH